MRANDSLALWARVQLGGPDECWEWCGQTSRGYGKVRVRCKWQYTHRLAWQHARGPIPDGLCVLHRCDNPPCCNPAHLFLGTQRDNAQDMIRKGRSRLRRGNPGRRGQSTPWG